MENPGSRLKGTTNYFLKDVFPHRRPALPAKGKVFKKKPFSSSTVSKESLSEPTSPKVSCMGQVKHINNSDRCDKAPPFARRICTAMLKMVRYKVSPSLVEDVDEGSKGEARPALLPLGQLKRFGGGREALADFDWREVKKIDSDGGEEDKVVVIAPQYALPRPALPLGQLKRLGGGREALADFDWREVKKIDSDEGEEDKVVVITPHYAPPCPAQPLGQLKRFRGGRDALADFDWREVKKIDSDEGEEDKVEVSPSHYAHAGEVVVELKKVVNLWKRRTFAPPIPLQLNSSCAYYI